MPTIAQDSTEQITLLAIDGHLLPFKRNLCFYMSKPCVRKEPVLVPGRDDPTAPDHLAAQFYGTVLRDGDQFRMWYYSVGCGSGEELRLGPVCYAQSEDGIHWTKPKLGQVSIEGSRDNNALKLTGTKTYGVAVIKDVDDPDPGRRYKMVYNAIDRQENWVEPALAGHARSTLRTATSADGLHWTVRPDFPLDVFVELSSAHQHDGLFIAHGQGKLREEGGALHGRRGYAWVSTDFNHWVQGQAETFALPEPSDTSQRGVGGQYDQVHLGVGAASYGSVVVGLYGLWHEQGWGLGGTTCDLGLVVSNDGIHFHEPAKGHIFISHENSSVTPVAGKPYPTILCQANGILHVAEQTRIYHGRWRNAPHDLDYYGEVALATIPRDRWGALGLVPGAEDGWVWSAPIQLPGGNSQFFLNADFFWLLQIEISDAQFNLLPEYSGPNSGAASDAERGAGIPHENGALDCPVVWPGAELSALRGKTVRFRVHLKNSQGQPRIFAMYIR